MLSYCGDSDVWEFAGSVPVYCPYAQYLVTWMNELWEWYLGEGQHPQRPGLGRHDEEQCLYDLE